MTPVYLARLRLSSVLWGPNKKDGRLLANPCPRDIEFEVILGFFPRHVSAEDLDTDLAVVYRNRRPPDPSRVTQQRSVKAIGKEQPFLDLFDPLQRQTVTTPLLISTTIGRLPCL